MADDETQFTFDTVQRNPQAAVMNYGIRSALPNAAKVVVAKQEISGETVKPKVHLVVMKDLLRELTPADRSELYNSLVLKNGRVVSMSLVTLRKIFDNKKVADIVESISYHPEVSDSVSEVDDGTPARFTEVAKSFKDLPTDIRDQFIDSMLFKNGSFVSASVDGLQKALTLVRMDEVIKAVTTTSGPLGKFGSKALCLGTTCYDAICRSGSGSTDFDCVDGHKSVCSATCHSD